MKRMFEITEAYEGTQEVEQIIKAIEKTQLGGDPIGGAAGVCEALAEVVQEAIFNWKGEGDDPELKTMISAGKQALVILKDASKRLAKLA